MAVVYWILGILLVFYLLGRVRLGILLRLEEKLGLDLRLGPVLIPLLSDKETAKSAEDKSQTPQKEKKEITMEELKGKLPKVSFTVVRDTWKELWPVCRKALERTRRDVQVLPLQLNLTLGGRNNPAATTKVYGWCNALVWSGMPALEQLLAIPKPGIHVGVDFERGDWQLRGVVGISVHLGTLVSIGFRMARPALRFLFGWMRQQEKLKKEDKAKQQTQQEKTAA